MSTEPPTLLPVSIHLPGEVISMIAEACVESCSIRVERHIDGLDNAADRLSVNFVSPISQLAVVSRDFQNGIRRGLRKSFSGHLTLPAECVNRATRTLRDEVPGWIVPETTQLHVYFTDYFESVDCDATGPTYDNVKNLTISCRSESIRRTTFKSFADEYDYPWAITQMAKSVLRNARPHVPSQVKVVVKIIWPLAPQGQISSYGNIEVRFLDHSRSRIMPAYETKSLDWMIRFPYPMPGEASV